MVVGGRGLGACGPGPNGQHGGATPDRDISLHNFSTRLWEQLVHFHVMWLTHWLFLWVGAMPHLCNLTVALCSHYDSIPVSTSLLRDTCGMTSTDLTRHLARKTNKQMFVSYNLQNTDSNLTLLVKHRIKEEMEAYPEKF
ncbi:proteasome assembly chaperone 4 [Panthera tigris]|uniref:proteasome assembly chaperone 4 n=1 Tax=Panthera tigris TaxID=9694 RepID=UPI00042BC851|nr:proteasome assembly chaperone 4 [Panthera tigris]